MQSNTATNNVPHITTIGFSGVLVNFSQQFSDEANRAALAYRKVVEEADLEGVLETSTSLTSVYIGFDPLVVSHEKLREILEYFVAERNWFQAKLPAGRKLWSIPTVYGQTYGPQLGEVAEIADKTTQDAITMFSKARLRVLTLGFAPGQPYLGTLPEGWHIPRQKGLTPNVPKGAVTTAISQIVLFAIAAPTGWRHIGQTAFEGFKPDRDAPYALTPGDEVCFPAINVDEYEALTAQNADGLGGASAQALQ